MTAMTPREQLLADLRESFVRWLTVDSAHSDARRKDFNQAIFDAERGYAIWNGTTLEMVLGKFDKAVKEVRSGVSL